MSKKPYTDLHHFVGIEGDPPLVIRPWPDHPTALELCLVGIQAKEHWGEVSVVMSRELADELGRALIAAAAHSLKK
jgi:hypothetical protein